MCAILLLMIARAFAHIISNALGVWAADYFVAGFIFSGSRLDLLKVALILAVANFALKPILKLISGFFILITFGLFNIVINMFILWLADYYMPEFTIQGMNALFFSTLILSALNLIIYPLLKSKK